MIPADNSKRSIRAVGQDAAPHLYAVGQIVRMKDSFARYLKRQNTFHVTATLPPSVGVPQYRIRNDCELHERVATEDNLERAGDSIGVLSG